MPGKSRLAKREWPQNQEFWGHSLFASRLLPGIHESIRNLSENPARRGAPCQNHQHLWNALYAWLRGISLCVCALYFSLCVGHHQTTIERFSQRQCPGRCELLGFCQFLLRKHKHSREHELSTVFE